MNVNREPDFLFFTETAQEVPREEKSKVALIIMAAVLLLVIMGWIPQFVGDRSINYDHKIQAKKGQIL